MLSREQPRKGDGIVRAMRLRRRRSRLPWIYLVYHAAHRHRPRRTARDMDDEPWLWSDD